MLESSLDDNNAIGGSYLQKMGAGYDTSTLRLQNITEWSVIIFVIYCFVIWVQVVKGRTRGGEWQAHSVSGQ